MSKLKDLKGQKFRHYIVTSRAKDTWDDCGTLRVNWNLKCLLCGSVQTVKARYLSRNAWKAKCCKNLTMAEKQSRLAENPFPNNPVGTTL